MKNNPNVLHIFSGYGGGISSLLLNLIENSYKSVDYTLLAFSYKGGENFIERMKATNTRILTMSRPRHDGILAFIRSIKAAFKTTRFDAVHCHIDGKSLILFRFIAKLYNTKTFIVHAHKTLYESKLDRTYLFHRINRWSNYHFSTHYMTCSDLAAEYIFGAKYLKRREAYLIPNGMNVEVFQSPICDKDKERFNKEFGISHGDLVICHVGRMTLAKNHDFILDIADKLRNNGVNYKLLLIGSGELESIVKQKCTDRNLTSNVYFAGRRLDIAKIMQYADLLILPSYNEGLPTVAVECQAAGTHMFLSDTITKQCDMELGLLKFLPLDLDLWVRCISNHKPSHLPILLCQDRIKERNFTAKDAGMLYINYLKYFISN